MDDKPLDMLEQRRGTGNASLVVVQLAGNARGLVRGVFRRFYGVSGVFHAFIII